MINKLLKGIEHDVKFYAMVVLVVHKNIQPSPALFYLACEGMHVEREGILRYFLPVAETETNIVRAHIQAVVVNRFRAVRTIKVYAANTQLAYIT